MTPFQDDAVRAAFDAIPEPDRAGLLQLRELILRIGADLPEVPSVTEGLRWGQPAYLTPARVGSTIRLGVPKNGGFAIYASCQSTIISDFADAYPGWDIIEGNRAVVFSDITQIDPVRHGALIRSALTYHLQK
ncbi:hypothetical protein FHS72_000219 [Loktanella ponticola]|uniref:DUF1801 domain-containing protein n=1 Tax=Yoonia ponticola TaxID=1524255 RepID=A0A7W9BHK3_9RHOB|nr:DUF1801 domain-containing protein [Yoonia ponticola]MBB5720615.1 hypothetical protein [Yoonia ponticola]